MRSGNHLSEDTAHSGILVKRSLDVYQPIGRAFTVVIYKCEELSLRLVPGDVQCIGFAWSREMEKTQAGVMTFTFQERNQGRMG